MTGNDYALVLRAGEQLSRQAVSCPTGEYVVVHQHDGNVVVYRNDDAVPVWATNTVFQPDIRELWDERADLGEAYGRPGRLLLTEDGDLVVLAADGGQLWSSGTGNDGITSLMIHDWGKLVLKNDRGHIRWQTPRAPKRWDGWRAVPDGRRLRRGQVLRGQTLTSDNGQYAFVHTFGGAVYLCQTSGPVLWAAFMGEGNGLELTDGGLLASRTPDGIFHAGNGIFSVPSGAAEFFVADDGHLVLAGEDGRVLWTGPPVPPPPPAEKVKLDTFRGPDERLRTPSTPVIRTDFSDDERWRQVCAEIAMEHDFENGTVSADVSFVEYPDLAGLTPEELVWMVPEDAYHVIALVVDSVTLSDPEHPVLVVELYDHSAATFRAVPRTMQEVENGLSLGNVDWLEIVENVDEDGVLR